MARILLALAVSLQLCSLAAAAPSSCTKVASISKCVSSIGSVISRTASASKWCSSVLGCPPETTITLTGTVTTTITKTVTESYTWEEIVRVYRDKWLWSIMLTVVDYRHPRQRRRHPFH